MTGTTRLSVLSKRNFWLGETSSPWYSSTVWETSLLSPSTPRSILNSICLEINKKIQTYNSIIGDDHTWTSFNRSRTISGLSLSMSAFKRILSPQQYADRSSNALTVTTPWRQQKQHWDLLSRPINGFCKGSTNKIYFNKIKLLNSPNIVHPYNRCEVRWSWSTSCLVVVMHMEYRWLPWHNNESYTVWIRNCTANYSQAVEIWTETNVLLLPRWKSPRLLNLINRVFLF